MQVTRAQHSPTGDTNSYPDASKRSRVSFPSGGSMSGEEHGVSVQPLEGVVRTGEQVVLIQV